MQDTDTGKKVSFFPFHAINEFMRDDYRQEVVRRVLESMADLPDEHRQLINRLTGKYVKIPGFRNSLKAPLPLRAKHTGEAFEKRPEMVAAILSAWAESHKDMRSKVFDLLLARGWELLPLDADRRKLPGFLTSWQNNDTFEQINEAYKSIHPDSTIADDDISLMVVWLSGRLPYQIPDSAD